MRWFIAILSLLILQPFALVSQPQSLQIYNNADKFAGGYCDSTLSFKKDGDGSLGPVYNNTACGLNYCQASLMTSTRYTSNPGAGFPATLSISCLPTCYTILQAYLWWSESSTNNTATATVTEPGGASSSYAANLSGSGADKCWSAGGTRVFRADVTASITTNGNYIISISSGSGPVDGITLFIIYTDPTATYQGSLVINDGAIVIIGGTNSQTLSGFSACDNSTYATAFAMGGDMQDNVGATHTTVLNGASLTFPQNFWNYDETTTTVTSGQSTSTFGFTPPGGDCWVFAAMGLYWQTTSCVTCTPPSGLTTSTTQVNVDCGLCNGSGTVSVSGGSTPYTYQWDDPATQTTATAGGLCAGTYNVTITDASGCNVNIESVIISDAGSTVTVTATATAASCFGVCDGTLSATATGGTSPYTYNWTVMGLGQNQTGVCAGTYTVDVTDANGCLGSATIEVTQPNPIDLFGIPLDETCAGLCDGQLFASVTGGTGPFTYTWVGIGTGQSQTNICPGTYTVNVVDANGCVQQNNCCNTVTVGTGGSITAGFTYNGNQCFTGNSFVFTNTGTTGVSYSWDFGDATTSTLENPTHIYAAAGAYTVTQTVTDGTCSESYTLTVSVYDEPTASIAGSNILCNGVCDGSANLTVTGGTTSYTYSWSNSATTEDINALCVGTYDVTVTDANGCTGIGSVAITEPTALSATVTGSNTTCNGVCDGSATVTASGGVGTYTYNWDDPSFQTTAIADSLCAGTFNVTVTDANGCTIVSSQLITEPSAIVLTPSATDATCGNADGSVSVAVSGGTSPYTYNWSNGCTSSSCTGVISGNYDVTVTDVNGCISLTTANVNDAGGGGTASITLDSDASCNGVCDGQLTASISGGVAPFTYLWDDPGAQTNTTATGLCAGSFNISITDGNGCLATSTLTVNEPAILNAVITGSTDASCNGTCDGNATVSVSGGTILYTYSWDNPGSSTTNTTASDLCAGTTYTASITDANGCTASATVVVTEPTVLAASIVGIDASCNGGSDGSANLTVTGGTGAYTFLWSNSATSEDISGLVAATYMVTITDANVCTVITSVVIGEPAPIDLSISVVDASCGLPNGSACVVATGGTSPYTYLWNDSTNQTTDCAMSIAAGSYSVTVTDNNGCFDITSVILNDLPGGNTSITLDNNTSGFSICDGQATSSLSTGTVPYTYIWNDPLAQTTATADSLCAGTWCVTITDAVGCTSSDCIVITEPPAVGTSIIGVDATCNGVCNGSADLTVIGGVSPYTYQWTGSFTTQDIAGLCAGTYYVTVTDANSISVIDSVVINEPTLLLTSTAGSGTVCFGSCDGSATVSASGATSPYTYIWNDPFAQTTATATGLCVGTFSVTVTDSKGCSTTDSYVVIEPAAVIVTVTTVTASCNQADGSASAMVTNGIGPLTYSWDNGCNTSTCSGLISNNYNVTVTDNNGCTGQGSGAVANANGPTANMTDSVDVSCPGGSDGQATITVTDGTPPYTYAWNTNPVQTNTVATGLTAGLAVLTITDDNGCVSSASVTIDEPPAFVASISAVDPSCNGSCNGVATVAASGGTGSYSYLWSDGSAQTTVSAAGLCAGAYTVTVTDANSCITTSNITLTDPSLLVLSVVESAAICGGSCDGSATVTAFGGTPGYSYSWNTTPLQTSQVASVLCAANYVVTVTDSNGCIATSNAIITEPAVVDATISSSGNINCAGNCNGFAQSAVTGGIAPYTYLWSNSQTTAQITNLCANNYIVTITDNNGCSDTASVLIIEPVALTISISATNVTCNGLCDGMATAAVAGGTGSYNYLWNDTYLQTTATADSLCDGGFNVNVSDLNGCTVSGSVSITQPQILLFTDAPVSSTCGDQNGSACVSIIGGLVPYTVIWNDPNVTVGLCVDSVYAGVLNPILFDGNGCTYTAPVIINDIVGPAIDSVITTDLSCFGDANGTATVYFSSGTPPFTYTWRNNAGDTIGFNSNFVFGLSGGTYTITLQDNNSCTYSSSFVIMEPDALSSAIIGSSTVSCFGSCDGTASVLAGNGTAPLSYSWTPSGDTVANVTGLCSGNNNVVIMDANGCQVSNGVVLTPPDALAITGTPTNITCSGANDGQISVSVSGGTGPNTYLWLPAGTGTGNLVTGLDAGPYTLQITDFNGCTANDSYVLTEPQVLTANGITNPSTCGDANGKAIVTSIIGGTPAYTYEWFDNQGNPIGQTSDTAFGLSGGPGIYYDVVITDKNTCQFTLTLPVNNIAGPDIPFAGGVDVSCFGGNDGKAGVSPIGGTSPYTYAWSDPLGQSTDTCYLLYAGTYIVTVTDLNNCVDTESVTINEPLPLVVVTSLDTFICIGGSANISVNAFGGTSGGGGPNPVYYYQWGNITQDTSAQTVTPTIETTYNVTVTDVNGCEEYGTIKVSLYPPITVSVNNDAICAGEIATLTANPSGGNSNIAPPYIYLWDDPGSSTTQTINFLPTGTGTFSVTVSDNCSPDAVATATIDVYNFPTASFTWDCDPYDIQFTDNSTFPVGDNIATYIWDFADNSTSNSANPLHAYSNSQNYIVELIVITDKGCSDTITEPVQSAPTAEFSIAQGGVTLNPAEVSILSPVVDFVDASSSDVIQWDWWFGDGSTETVVLPSFYQGATISHEYVEHGIYQIRLSVENQYGCVDTVIYPLLIKGEFVLFAPSAFTPNGDAVNDYFFPKGIGVEEDEFELFIYDRWGDLIAKVQGEFSDDPTIGWDGKANRGNNQAQQDVYVWLIRTEDVNGEKHEYIGHVTLMK